MKIHKRARSLPPRFPPPWKSPISPPATSSLEANHPARTSSTTVIQTESSEPKPKPKPKSNPEFKSKTKVKESTMPKRTLADRSPQQETTSVSAGNANANATAGASPVPVPKSKKARAKAKKQDKAKGQDNKAKGQESNASTVMGPPAPKHQDVKKECPKLALARLWAKKAADLEKPFDERQYAKDPIPFKIGEDGIIHPAEPQTIPRYEGSVHSTPALTKDAIADILRKTKPDCPQAQAWIKAQESSKLARERMQATMGEREDLRKKVIQKIRDQARLAAVHSGAPKHEIKSFLAEIPDNREESKDKEMLDVKGVDEDGPQNEDGAQVQREEDLEGRGIAVEVEMKADGEQKKVRDDSDDERRKKGDGKKERTLEEAQLQRVVEAHERFLAKMNDITSGLKNI